MADEKRLHDIIHLPYRSWCPECVCSREGNWISASISCGHATLVEDALPNIGTAYHYMGAEGEDGIVPMLRLKDYHTKVVLIT